MAHPRRVVHLMDMEAKRIIARRIGRIAFGCVLLAGVAHLLVTAWPWPRSLFGARTSELHAARAIMTIWLVAAAAGVMASRIAVRLPLAVARDRLFARSVVVPVLGIALLLPITLHMPIFLVFGEPESFDLWVVASIFVSGLTHVVFATMCACRARNLVAGVHAQSPRSIFVVTLITSCMPFILLFAIPPVVVAITLMPFLPLFHAMDRRIERERQAMAEALHVLPRAIVHGHRRGPGAMRDRGCHGRCA